MPLPCCTTATPQPPIRRNVLDRPKRAPTSKLKMSHTSDSRDLGPAPQQALWWSDGCGRFANSAGYLQLFSCIFSWPCQKSGSVSHSTVEGLFDRLCEPAPASPPRNRATPVKVSYPPTASGQFFSPLQTAEKKGAAHASA